MRGIPKFTLLIVFFMIMIFTMIIDKKDVKENNGKDNIFEVKGKVLDVDNSNVVESGIIKLGNQNLTIEIIEGNFKGITISGTNLFSGKMDVDTFYKVNDKLIVGILVEDGNIIDARAIDYYRQTSLLLMFLVFSFALIIFAKFIGVKALFSFVASLIIIWKFYIPNLLSGENPIAYTFFTIMLLSLFIMFSVAGFSKKAIIAFLGTIFGLIVTIFITIFFGNIMNLHGMTAPFAETLLFRGYFNLNMRDIFYSSIIIGASGAAMDIAMDISASMEEIQKKKPEIEIRELIKSGFSVGQSVIGTMTTTLLLAYSGGYLTLLMVFYSQNSSLSRILNMKIVSAEIMRIVVGSIGLVLVAPITAILAGYIYCNNFRLKKT